MLYYRNLVIPKYNDSRYLNQFMWPLTSEQKKKKKENVWRLNICNYRLMLYANKICNIKD